MAESELAAKLSRQQQINEGEVKPVKVSQSVYAEFKEFSIQEIKEYRKVFQKWVSWHPSTLLLVSCSHYPIVYFQGRKLQ